MDAISKTRVPADAARTTEEEQQLRLLVDTGLALATERDAGKISQIALDAARILSCARFGVFFYEALDSDGHPAQLHFFSAEEPSLLEAPFSLTLGTHFDLIERDGFRSGDINAHPDFIDKNPFEGTPFAQQAVRSLFSVPVRDRQGALLGGILLGHPNIDAFGPREEQHVLTVATQAAAALENAGLARNISQEANLADSARRAMAEATRRLRQALDAAELGTWTWNRETDMLDLDERAAELLDAGQPHTPVSRTELRKRIVHTEDIGLTAVDMREALRGGSYNAEYRVENSEGRIRWIASRGIATFGADSAAGPDIPREMSGMIGTLQDITVRKMQEASLRQSEKLAATGRMAATIAHEINNPLEAVTNLIYLCKTDPGVPLPIQQLLNTADNELERVSQIAQQTLGFYRDTTRPVDINMTELLESVVNLFSRKMDHKKIRYELDVKPGLHIFGLQGEIRQVFSNLLVNAIDASSRSLIRIRAHRTRQNGKDGVSVLVADQGSGIPPSAVQQLFSPFFTTKQSVGTGLGLWVTRGIVEKQGGTIRFRTSTTAPTGTVFRVFLPAEFLKAGNFTASQTTRIQ